MASQVEDVVYSAGERSVGVTVVGRYQGRYRYYRILGRYQGTLNTYSWRGDLNNASRDDVHCRTDDEFRRHLEQGKTNSRIHFTLTWRVYITFSRRRHDVDPVITDDDVKRQINKLSLTKRVDQTVFHQDRLPHYQLSGLEQAGAQRNRGCVEHIVTLRLLTDMVAKRKRKKLFSDVIGCSGNVSCDAVCFGAVAMTATLGVRQGSHTSSFLYVVFVKMVKNMCENEGRLQWLHILVFMDDTVLFGDHKDEYVKKN
ncbi:hypothetical protein E2C01_050058 [Portunus trituberculatus]|uniref:Reverse transcriptase domain-containing protein n=1 Tax=Portunus trituberculatus TaxID=210409 RepID=A0A5B7GEV8_PORTR|nr:hypothetical protein [Portunus trituberculatus]